MRNGCAYLRARLRDLMFSLPLSRDALPDSGLSSHYPGIARLRAASTWNVFRNDTRSIRRGAASVTVTVTELAPIWPPSVLFLPEK